MSKKPALDGVSFSVRRGEIFGLLGPNGGGKTTLFKILSTLLVPSSGRASLFGQDVLAASDAVRKKIGVVFQSPSLDAKLTVKENLVHQGHLYGLSGKPLESKIQETLAALALSDRRDDRVEILSGGLKRRAEIAKGLLHNPELLLMDEPSTGLDPGARKDLWDLLAELKKSGMTICVTTHLMEEAEKCDRLAILSEGKLVALDRPETLKEEIGGDVIWIQSERAEELARKIKSDLGVDARAIEGAVRVEKERGHEFLPQLATRYAADIQSLTLAKPSLEDVFIRKTGHRFWKI